MVLMTVCHGGYQAVEKPEIRINRNTKDFGMEFYCTVIKEQAHDYDVVIGDMADDQIYIIALTLIR